MLSMLRSGGCVLNRLALALALGLVSGPASRAGDGDPVAPGPVLKAARCGKCEKCLKAQREESYGTLGYGPPGLHPGFQGFGLGYHPGHGYGGDALGVGAEGGYPLYGGPGYPHPAPCLRRAGGITPFLYFGGPGYPSSEHPQYFGAAGPLVADEPVVTMTSDQGDPGYGGGYGPSTGALPYPESFFDPFTAGVSDENSSAGRASDSPPMSKTNSDPASGKPPLEANAVSPLGVAVASVVDADGTPGLKVTKADPGGAAEKAGLHAGDVIRSINGYRTELPANLAWIIANAAPDRTLKLTVRAASDGQGANPHHPVALIVGSESRD